MALGIKTEQLAFSNTHSDRESRECETRTEWMLNKEAFNYLTTALKFHPRVDLFASRINTQLPCFYSYRADPECQVVDAFTTDWENIDFYAFPPFICIPRVIQKIWNDRATGILVVPDWPNQPWYDQFSELVVKRSYSLL